MLTREEIKKVNKVIIDTKKLHRISHILYKLDINDIKDDEYTKYLNEYEKLNRQIKEALVAIINNDPAKDNDIHTYLLRTGYITDNDYNTEFAEMINSSGDLVYQKIIFFLLNVMTTLDNFNQKLFEMRNDPNYNKDLYNQFLVVNSTIDRDRLLMFLRLLDENKKKELLEVKYKLAFIVPYLDSSLIDNRFVTDQTITKNINLNESNLFSSITNIKARSDVIDAISCLLQKPHTIEEQNNLEYFIRANLLLFNQEDFAYVSQFIKIYMQTGLFNQKQIENIINLGSYLNQDNQTCFGTSYQYRG